MVEWRVNTVGAAPVGGCGRHLENVVVGEITCVDVVEVLMAGVSKETRERGS